MSLQNDIKDLVISFFEMVGSLDVDDELYEASISQEYYKYFKKQKIVFTFERDVAVKHNCELIIPGSKLLLTIIEICAGSGPISIKKSQIDNQCKAIRYHFFVSFSGIRHVSKLIHVDVDLETAKSVNISETLQDAHTQNEMINPEKILPTYVAALDELQERCQKMKADFVSDADKRFQDELDLFTDKHDSQIRDIDDSINKKERQSEDSQKIKNFRFDSIAKIKAIEADKIRLIETLQKKHKIHLKHSLIACEVITY